MTSATADMLVPSARCGLTATSKVAHACAAPVCSMKCTSSQARHQPATILHSLCSFESPAKFNARQSVPPLPRLLTLPALIPSSSSSSSSSSSTHTKQQLLVYSASYRTPICAEISRASNAECIICGNQAQQLLEFQISICDPQIFQPI